IARWECLPTWSSSRITEPYYKNFIVDRAARLGKSSTAQPDFAFRSRHGLDPLQRFKPSTFNERTIHRVTRFGSHGCAVDWPRIVSSPQRRSYLGSSCSRYRAGPAERLAEYDLWRWPNR